MIAHDLAELAHLAATDYDAFWTGLTDEDRELSMEYCSSDTFDTMVNYQGQVYLFIHNEQTGGFTVEHYADRETLD